MNDITSLPRSVAPTSGLDFPVVGIGASAGGMATMLKVLAGLPAAPDMAFVVIFHLSPTHESYAPKLLQAATPMPVVQVQSDVRIERNHVYVIPPNHDLRMFDGHLGLSDPTRRQGPHVAIDLFFRTLGENHGDRAVGVVLSGTGSDGAVGLARIKECGGVVIAQAPEDAEYDGMPKSAVATGKVDFVLPATEIARKLLDLWANAKHMEVPSPHVANLHAHASTSPDAAELALREVMATLARRTGHDFSHYKRATVLRRVERRMQVCATPHVQAYSEYLRHHNAEADALLDDMLIGVTNFFRDPDAFEALERDVLPELFDAGRAGEPLRVWVAGCSTGEEAYSTSILLAEQGKRTKHERPTQIFATDIDVASLAVAREGAYPSSIATDVSDTRLHDFFLREPEGYRVSKPLRERMLFAVHDILRDPPFSRLDLVTCRNLLIYLDRAAQHDVLQMFHFALRPGGYLFLGTSETADAAPKLFSTVDKRHRIYRANANVKSTRSMPQFPLGSVLPRNRPRPAIPTVENRKLSVGELHQKLLEEYAPPSVIINHDSDIVHVSARAGRYLRFGEGEPTHNLVQVVQPELRPELRTALFQAIQFNASVEARSVDVARDGHIYHVKMTARPVQHPDWPAELILVLFDEVEQTLEARMAGSGSGGDKVDPVLFQLESELQRKDDQLRTTIEQYEASAEELKASNEELQAINEELRSTSEELETSTEELQSTNEEMITVNQELKAKIDETTDINDDLQNLIGATDIATVFVDHEMKIKRFTPAARTVFNIIDTDLGRSIFDITHRLEYDSLAADAAATFDTLKTIEREVRSADGRWFLARLLPYRTAADRIDGAVLSFIDITSRMRAEASVRMSEEHMRLVADNMPDFAILTLDLRGRFTSWSAGAERIFGWSEAEVLGQHFELIFLPLERAQNVPELELKRALETGRASDERWHLRKDGSTFYASGVTTQLRGDRLQGFAKIARDATHQLQDESSRDSRLSQAMRGAAEATADSRMKSEFLAVMSHELKHPLNLINVNTQVLMTLPEAQSLAAVMKAARTIQKTVQSQARIIDDLLDMSRTHAGKLTVNLTPLWLGEAIQPLLAAAAQEAGHKRIVFKASISDEPLLVSADPIRLEQIVWNLLSNAVKFTRSGGAIEVSLTRAGSDALLRVSDNGRGILPSFLPHVFEMFRQADSQTTREEGGLGIGLALVASLVALHGGRVAVDSPGGGMGSTFRVWLPLHMRSDFGPLLDDATAVDSPNKGVRVLLVDDTADTLETFGYLLEAKGMVVTSASTGEQALDFARDRDFDLVISDIGMPHMDGYQLMEKLRDTTRAAQVPAIALTGYGRPQDVQRAMAAGYSAHLDKPVDFARLNQLVSQLLADKARAVAAAAGAAAKPAPR